MALSVRRVLAYERVSKLAFNPLALNSLESPFGKGGLRGIRSWP